MLRYLILSAGCAAALLGATQAAAQKASIRVSSFTPERSIVVKFGFIPFIKAVAADAGDVAELHGYWGGSLGRAPKKQFDLVKSGVTDIAIIGPGFTPGRFPGFSVFELPMLARTAVEGSKAMWRLHKGGHLGGFEDVIFLGATATDANALHTRVSVGTPPSFKGLKLRAGGPVLGQTVRLLGAAPIGLPVTQATEAFSRGVVDGVLMGFGGLGIFRMDSIAKFHYVAPLGIGPFANIMNRKTWDALPRKAREAIARHGQATLGLGGSKGFEIVAGGFKKKMKKSGGHSFVALTGVKPATVKPVHDAWIAKTPNGRRIYDAYVAALADIRAGR